MTPTLLQAHRVQTAARAWVQALRSDDVAEAQRWMSPRFQRHNGWSAEQYLLHEAAQYREHTPFAGWEEGFDVQATWLDLQGCWSILVLNARNEVTTRFWWWWDDDGICANGWPFQMIPKLSWGPWGLRRKITHDAHASGWNMLPLGRCEDTRREQHAENDNFGAVSWSFPNDEGKSCGVRVQAQHRSSGERFKTTVWLPGVDEPGFVPDAYPRLKGPKVWVPPQATHAFALDVRFDHGHAHVQHPGPGWHRFDQRILNATLTDRLDHDWTVVSEN